MLLLVRPLVHACVAAAVTGFVCDMQDEAGTADECCGTKTESHRDGHEVMAAGGCDR